MHWEEKNAYKNTITNIVPREGYNKKKFPLVATEILSTGSAIVHIYFNTLILTVFF